MDLELTGNENGPDLIMKSRDLSVIEGFQTAIMLALFGGNVEQSTPTERVVGEQNFDWWGNSLLLPNNKSEQFNSLTERVLSTASLGSAGRIQIENAVKTDLEFMKSFAKIEVEVSVAGVNKVAIVIKVNQPNNIQGNQFLFMWDAAKKEIVQ